MSAKSEAVGDERVFFAGDNFGEFAPQQPNDEGAAQQGEGSGYLAAPRKTQSFTVIDPIAQTIAFTSTPPNPPIVGGAYTVTATRGPSGNPVTFSSLTPGTCGISGAMVSFTAAGGKGSCVSRTCTLTRNERVHDTHESWLIARTTIAELADYEIRAGTIHFQPSKPLPDKLIKTMIKERMADIDEAAAAKGAKNK